MSRTSEADRDALEEARAERGRRLRETARGDGCVLKSKGILGSKFEPVPRAAGTRAEHSPPTRRRSRLPVAGRAGRPEAGGSPRGVVVAGFPPGGEAWVGQSRREGVER